MAEHNKLGILGENIATEFLAEKGYYILQRNWVSNKQEVDIIAMDGDELVFIEVKTRSANCLEDPEQAVTISKQRSIIRVANTYIVERDISNEARFDIVSILIHKDKEHEINHIKDAFYPIVK